MFMNFRDGLIETFSDLRVAETHSAIFIRASLERAHKVFTAYQESDLFCGGETIFPSLQGFSFLICAYDHENDEYIPFQRAVLRCNGSCEVYELDEDGKEVSFLKILKVF